MAEEGKEVGRKVQVAGQAGRHRRQAWQVGRRSICRKAGRHKKNWQGGGGGVVAEPVCVGRRQR